jgi:hypothetical protein
LFQERLHTAVSCVNYHGVAVDAYILYKQVTGTESHTFTINQEPTTWPTVRLVNAAGVASATFNVSTVSVDLNASSLISGFTGLETTVSYEPSLSDTFTVTTTGATGDFVTIFVTTPLE